MNWKSASSTDGIGIVGEDIIGHIEGKLGHMLWEELDGFSPSRCCFKCGNPHHLTLSGEAFQVL